MVFITKKKNNTSLIVALLTIIIITASVGFIISSIDFEGEQATSPTGVGTQASGGIFALPFGVHYLNITVVTEQGRPINEVWVGYFERGFFRDSGWTDSDGQISFEIAEGEYEVKCERYQYAVATENVTIEENTNLTITMIFQETTYAGLPSWTITLILGLGLLGIIYLGRKALEIRGWTLPKNWFGRAKDGAWTFIDKSTKNGLYLFSAFLLIVLITIVIPNFPTLQNMAVYYVALGGLALGGLFLEGHSKKFWIASLGFGKKSELMGNILIGLSFALIFLSVAGFASQLDFISIPLDTLIAIAMTIIVASFFEEAFHSGILAPTIAEKSGIIPSIFVTSLIFMLGHGLAYGWVFFPLIAAFSFRMVATTIVLHRKSWAGMCVAHIVINTLSVFAIIAFTG